MTGKLLVEILAQGADLSEGYELELVGTRPLTCSGPDEVIPLQNSARRAVGPKIVHLGDAQFPPPIL